MLHKCFMLPPLSISNHHNPKLPHSHTPTILLFLLFLRQWNYKETRNILDRRHSSFAIISTPILARFGLIFGPHIGPHFGPHYVAILPLKQKKRNQCNLPSRIKIYFSVLNSQQSSRVVLIPKTIILVFDVDCVCMGVMLSISHTMICASLKQWPRPPLLLSPTP